jgi:lipopolysaccharide/colanic/teichoic acid biosynthesis glycosyltransferase
MELACDALLTVAGLLLDALVPSVVAFLVYRTMGALVLHKPDRKGSNDRPFRLVNF